MSKSSKIVFLGYTLTLSLLIKYGLRERIPISEEAPHPN